MSIYPCIRITSSRFARPRHCNSSVVALSAIRASSALHLLLFLTGMVDIVLPSDNSFEPASSGHVRCCRVPVSCADLVLEHLVQGVFCVFFFNFNFYSRW